MAAILSRPEYLKWMADKVYGPWHTAGYAHMQELFQQMSLRLI